MRPGSAAPPHLSVVVAPGVLADVRTAAEVLGAATAARGATGELLRPATAGEFAATVRRVAAAGEFVLLPADAADLDASGLDLAGTQVVRVDLEERTHDPSAAVRRHVRGRGLDGIRFAVDAWSSHRTSPPRRHSYGEDHDQRAELRVPAGEGPFPVAVLVHGGYWRLRWENDLMDAAAIDLTARGYATWNVEYRRPDDHDWDATTADVDAALQALAGVDAPLDLDRVVTLGHSAGGQLVARLAADCASRPGLAVRPALTVSLAGVLDLVTADRRWLGEGAVSKALGGRAAGQPQRYADSSPAHRLPLGSPWAVVVGRQDDLDLLDVSRTVARDAAAAGDDVVLVEGEGDHFSVIDPASTLWAAVVDLLEARTRA